MWEYQSKIIELLALIPVHLKVDHPRHDEIGVYAWHDSEGRLYFYTMRCPENV